MERQELENSREFKAAKELEQGYGYALRNKYSHEICKKIVESGVLDDKRIPFI